MRGWQANERHTCVLPVVLGLCPKLKYPLLCRGIIIKGVYCFCLYIMIPAVFRHIPAYLAQKTKVVEMNQAFSECVSQQ